MLSNRGGPGDEYEEWEYPDPKDVEDLSDRPIMDEPRSEGQGFSTLKMVVVGVVAVSLIGSLMVPLLASPRGGAAPEEVIPAGGLSEEAAAYDSWLSQNVDSALREWGAGGRAQYLGAEFDISVSDPIIGVLVNGLDPASDSGKSEMQNYSIAILGRIFDDPRASSVTLFWYNLETGDDGATQLEAAMVVGILRQTAAGIDWASLRAVELADEVDLYRDLEAEATGTG